MLRFLFFFFFNDTATTEIYTLSLHDALPISSASSHAPTSAARLTMACRISFDSTCPVGLCCRRRCDRPSRSEEHTSELQSQSNIVCRLLLEKKNKTLTDHDLLPLPYCHHHRS